MPKELKNSTYAIIKIADSGLPHKAFEIFEYFKNVFGSNVQMKDALWNTYIVKINGIDVYLYITHIKGNGSRCILRISHDIANISNISIKKHKDTIFEIKETHAYKDGSSRINIAEAISLIKTISEKQKNIKDVQQKTKLDTQLSQMALVGKIRVAISEKWQIEPCKETVYVYINDRRGIRRASIRESKEGSTLGQYCVLIGSNTYRTNYAVSKEEFSQFIKSLEGTLDYAQ